MYNQRKKIKIWQRTDIDGFFGLFTNNLTNLLVMAGLLMAIGIPADITFGTILPAVGLSIFVSSVIYSVMAYKLAVKENRNTVTSLPSGSSVTHMFLIVYLIMGPVYQSTGDPYLAWYASLAWGFIEGVIELIGAIFGERLRKVIPRAAMLGSLAGASITFIAMTPAMQTFDLPYIGLISLIIILLGWFGKVSFPFKIPVGFVAIIVGTIIGWSTGLMDLGLLIESFESISLSLPSFSVYRIFSGLSEATPFLVSAIPLGIYNMFETIDNIESAEAAGDNYNTFHTMIADGSTSILASLFGSPFPTAVFIGHPGWKEAGARIGYTLATGAGILTITWLGLISLLLNIIPIEAILPILVYVGLVIGSQAFQEVEKKYAPAVVIAIIPWLADWGRNLIDNSLASLNTNAADIGVDLLSAAGVEYSGMIVLGSGAIIVGMLWSAILSFIIDNDFYKASLVAFIGTVFSFFGVIHSQTVGFNEGGELAVSYALVALIILLMNYLKKYNNGGITYDKKL
ncbi:putative MFS transporter, AGZA family, xanthine/uracil permease [Alkalibacterium putridalgicola]|uniref:Putative MFS transporter, AGZA family, xanthine/uracil permease n=1 Tax=Alkalibacterium putridalgicola TaxID=426703 RepID=A0A1H7UT85_9LACT|nr:xanthine permease [Alkalibacterium putridalgicola]GEK88495.1 hypothetical protein APU01nite_05340 [Alkalibacterium putridalgicola]SEL99885.1 putative MFS transporter, AGZA family, xanthine/uracil permease [Alkalibacterium putridalgicola]